MFCPTEKKHTPANIGANENDLYELYKLFRNRLLKMHWQIIPPQVIIEKETNEEDNSLNTETISRKHTQAVYVG